MVALAFSEDGRYLRLGRRRRPDHLLGLARPTPAEAGSARRDVRHLLRLPDPWRPDPRRARRARVRISWSVLHGKEWQDLNGGEQQDFLKQVGDPQAMAAFLQRHDGQPPGARHRPDPQRRDCQQGADLSGFRPPAPGRSGPRSRKEIATGWGSGRPRTRAAWSTCTRNTSTSRPPWPCAPRGDLVASGDYLGNIHVWASRTGAVRWKLTGAGRPVYRVAFDAGTEPGYRLAFGTTPHGKDKWGRNHYGELEQTFDLKEHVLRDGAPRCGTTSRWPTSTVGPCPLRREASSGRFFLDCRKTAGPRAPCLFQTTSRCATACSGLRSRGSRIPVVVGTINGSVDAYDPKTLMQRRMFAGHLGAIMALSESPDGRYLASGSTDRTTRIWNLENGSGTSAGPTSTPRATARFPT